MNRFACLPLFLALSSCCCPTDEPSTASAEPPSALYRLTYADRFLNTLREHGHEAPAFSMEKEPDADGFYRLTADFRREDVQGQLVVYLAGVGGGLELRRATFGDEQVYPNRLRLGAQLEHCHDRATAAAREEVGMLTIRRGEPEILKLRLDDNQSRLANLHIGQLGLVSNGLPSDIEISPESEDPPFLQAVAYRNLRTLGTGTRAQFDAFAKTDWVTGELTSKLEAAGFEIGENDRPNYWSPASFRGTQGRAFAIRSRVHPERAAALVYIASWNARELELVIVRAPW